MKIETTVPRHRKFLQAGPDACWLWLCGLCYCQDGLTNGFIPEASIGYLGIDVKIAERLAQKLVREGLWKQIAHGWIVHDYLDWNRSRADVESLRLKRQEAGASGGRTTQQRKRQEREAITDSGTDESSEQSAFKQTSSVYKHAVVVAVPPSSSSSVGEGGVGETHAPLDAWLRELCARYPNNRVTQGYRTETAFMEQMQRDGRAPAEVWAEMQANLQNQMQGHEWRVKGMVPTLDKWLSEGRWRQRHEAQPSESKPMFGAWRPKEESR